MQAKEFLGTSNVEFRSYNIFDDPEGRKVHEELGNPPVPCLIVDGQKYQLLHASQIASILGIPMPGETSSTARACYDIVTIMESWLGMLDKLNFDLMKSPTKSRGRPVTLMTVNSFHPISLLPRAWEDGTFEWHTRESDQRREAILKNADGVRKFAKQCSELFEIFLVNHEQEFDQRDPVVTTIRGEIPFSVLIQSQRSHIAIHHRQMIDFLGEHGISNEDILDVDAIPGLNLPASLY